ncbi:hypothetical protein MY8738_003164 [Beauveria namnaoensis]
MLATILLQTLPLVPAVLAGTVQYPEVVPGPGLPSLESLGLTSEDLYKMEPASPDTEVNARASLAPMFNPACATDSRAYTAVNNLNACERYLARIGLQDCTVPSNFKTVRYCFSGDADVNGVSITGRSLTSTWRGTTAAGSEAAFGNGDIIVTGVNRNFS